MYTNLEGHINMKLEPIDIERMNSVVATIGLNLIYIHRHNESVLLSREESINARGVSQVIADEFMTLSDEVKKQIGEVALPYMRHARMEMVIHSGIDRIIEVLKGLFEGKEVSNG